MAASQLPVNLLPKLKHCKALRKPKVVQRSVARIPMRSLDQGNRLRLSWNSKQLHQQTTRLYYRSSQSFSFMMSLSKGEVRLIQVLIFRIWLEMIHRKVESAQSKLSQIKKLSTSTRTILQTAGRSSNRALFLYSVGLTVIKAKLYCQERLTSNHGSKRRCIQGKRIVTRGHSIERTRRPILRSSCYRMSNSIRLG